MYGTKPGWVFRAANRENGRCRKVSNGVQNRRPTSQTVGLLGLRRGALLDYLPPVFKTLEGDAVAPLVLPLGGLLAEEGGGPPAADGEGPTCILSFLSRLCPSAFD